MGTGSGFWNTSMNTSNLVLYGLDTCSEVKITGSAAFWGAMYAPSAEIRVTGSGDIYGSLIGDTIKVTGSGDIHYDEALKDSANFDILPPAYESDYVVIQWREIH